MAARALLALALAVKLLHVPERFVRGRPEHALFDYSPLHSHALWHLGVWAVQLRYHAFVLSPNACCLAFSPRTNGQTLKNRGATQKKTEQG